MFLSRTHETMEVDEGVLLSELITDQNSSCDDIPDNSSIAILDSLLKCSICYDYFDTCVITDCSHNFCSLCIRRYIQYKTECPVCFKELYDSSLRANRVVDEFRKLFPEIKDRIVKCVRTINSRKPNDVPISPAKNAEFKTPKTVHAASSKTSSVSEVATVSHKPSPVSPTVPKPSGTQTQSSNDRILIPKMFFSPAKKSASNADKNCVMQECPVCNVFIPERNMNRHLDDCLKRTEEASKAKNCPPVNKRAPLPKLVFRLLSSTNLRNKAKEYGLNHHGDNETLKNRIQKYTALHNAECDKPNPRPISELIRQLEKEEKLLTSQKLPKNNILTHMGDVTEKSKLNAQYLKENKKSFDDLIGKMKNQLTSKTKETKTAPVADYCQPSTSKTHFDLSCGAANDDMLEIDEIKIEKVESLYQPDPEPVQPEKHSSEEEDVFNPIRRTNSLRKRLDFEDASPEPPLFDAETMKIEPDLEIFEAITDCQFKVKKPRVKIYDARYARNDRSTRRLRLSAHRKKRRFQPKPLTDDENDRIFSVDSGDEDDDSSDSPVYVMSTRRKRKAGAGSTKKNLRKRKR